MSIFGKTRRFESFWTDTDVARIVELYDYEMTKKEETLKKKKEGFIHRPMLIDDTQREYGWNAVFQCQLIVSIFIGYPIPAIYIDRHNKRSYDYIMDGRQRVETLWRFVNNKFQIEYNGEEYFFKDLPEEDKNKFLTTQIKMCLCIDWPKPSINDLFLKLQNSKPLTNHEKVAAMSADKVYNFVEQPNVKALETLFHQQKAYFGHNYFCDVILCIALMVRDLSFERLTDLVSVTDSLGSSEYPEGRKKDFDRVIGNLTQFCEGFRHYSRVGKTHLLTLAGYFLFNEGQIQASELENRGRNYDLLFLRNEKSKEKPILGGIELEYAEQVKGKQNNPKKLGHRVEKLKEIFSSKNQVTMKPKKDEPVVIPAEPIPPSAFKTPKKRTSKKQLQNDPKQMKLTKM